MRRVRVQPLGNEGEEDGEGDGREGVADKAAFWEGGFGNVQEDLVEELGWEAVHCGECPGENVEFAVW